MVFNPTNVIWASSGGQARRYLQPLLWPSLTQWYGVYSQQGCFDNYLNVAFGKEKKTDLIWQMSQWSRVCVYSEPFPILTVIQEDKTKQAERNPRHGRNLIQRRAEDGSSWRMTVAQCFRPSECSTFISLSPHNPGDRSRHPWGLMTKRFAFKSTRFSFARRTKPEAASGKRVGE